MAQKVSKAMPNKQTHPTGRALPNHPFIYRFEVILTTY